MVLKFKTNAKCKGCEQAIKLALSSLAPLSNWSIDLSSEDKILTYNGQEKLDPNHIMNIIKEAGFQAKSI